MDMSALKNDNSDSPNYLVPHTRTGNSINFGQRTVNHWPVVNLNVPTSLLCKIQHFILFGLISNSPQFLFAVVLAPIFCPFNLFPSSGPLNLFISVHFTQLGRSAGGRINPDSFHLQEIASLLGICLVHLGLGQTALARVKPMFKVRWNLAKLR